MTAVVLCGALGLVLGSLVTVGVKRVAEPARGSVSFAATVLLPIASERLFSKTVGSAILWIVFVACFWGSALVTELALFARRRLLRGAPS